MTATNRINVMRMTAAEIASNMIEKRGGDLAAACKSLRASLMRAGAANYSRKYEAALAIVCGLLDARSETTRTLDEIRASATYCAGHDGDDMPVAEYDVTYTSGTHETVRYCADCAAGATENGEIVTCVPVAERVAFARLAFARATETNTDAGLYRSARARVDIPALHESAEYTDTVRGGFVLAGTVLAVRRLGMYAPTVEITFANGDRIVSAHADESAIVYTDDAGFTEHTSSPCRSCGATFRVTRAAIDATRREYADAEHPMTDAECAASLDFCLPCVAGIYSLGEIVTGPNDKHVADVAREKCHACGREYPTDALRDFSAIDEMPVLVCASCVADADAAAADERMRRHAIG